MVTQATKKTERDQPAQGAMVRTAQQHMNPARRGGYALGLPLAPADFFRMNPLSLMRRMTEEVDRMFEESNVRGQVERMWSPAIEVSQQEGNYVVRAELPGVNANDVKLEITDDAIVIQGERKVQREETKGGIHITERRYGKFYRAIPLPDGARIDEANAKYENGVLEITVPAEEHKNKRREIPIQGSSSGTAGGANGKPDGGAASGSQKAS